MIRNILLESHQIKIRLLIFKFEFKYKCCYKSQIQMMNRTKSTTRKSSIPHTTSKNKIVNKRQLSDTVYLMQNQNDILKLKNQQLSYKLDSINMELRQRTQRVADAQRECQRLKQMINGSIYVKDIELQNQKMVLLDRIALGNQNIQIYKEKIADSRKQVVLEEQKIPQLISDRHLFEQQLRIIKMENQGSKKVLINLESQNEELRQRNNSLSLKKYSKQPEQRTISEQIEQRIRLIKNLNSTQKISKKQKTANLILNILHNLSRQKKKLCFLTVERYGLKKAILKKKLFLLAHIRKNYLNSVKARIMTVFREPLKSVQEQEKCIKILKQIGKRRQKAKIWRIWRNEIAKAEYSLIRKYESQNTIQKICQISIKNTLIASFQRIKYFKNNHKAQIAISKICISVRKALNKPFVFFFSLMKNHRNSLEIDQEIQNSAQQHSKMLILSRMFFGWVALMKQKRKQSLSLKFKYFKRMKKIFVIKKRNVLSQILGESKIKINSINIKSVCFGALKQQMYSNKEQRAIEENTKITEVLINFKSDTQNRLKFDVQVDKELALMKIRKYLQKKTKEAFTIWRKQHQRIYSIQKILSIVSFNLQKTVNYAYSRIQIRRFQKLKVSIRDKIASCDYSYNYLVQENTHIKTVLDKKSHQLQKAKFVTIIQRLIRRQKEIKHKYFYKFLKNGYKCWKVKKSLQNIDYLMNKKISLVLFFLLKLNKTEKIQQQRIQYSIQRKDNNIVQLLLKNSIQGFRLCRQRNKRMRRALTGIFDRNLQLNFFQAFGKIRNEAYKFQINDINSVQNQIQNSISQTNQNIQITEETIHILTERLKNKEETFKERKTMTIYKFFLKNIKEKVGTYIWKWKQKVDQQKRIMKFVDILDRKTISMVKMKFLIALQKSKEELQKKQLESRLEKYKNEYEHASTNFDKFVTTSQQKMTSMKIQNDQNNRIIQLNKNKTNHMNNVKVESFLKYWGKNMCKFVFREWKNQKNEFLQRWNQVFYLLGTHSIRDAFQKLSGEIRFQLVKDRIKNNLLIIYDKTFKSNAGLAFKIWRNVNILKKVRQNQTHLREAMKGMQHLEEHYENVKRRYQAEVNQRISYWKLRRITNAWRIYTQKKINNTIKFKKLQTWLSCGYSAEIVGILKHHKVKSLQQKNKFVNFQNKINTRKAKAFIDFLYGVKVHKNSIQRLFIGKFCYYQIHKLKEQFLTRIKNFYRQKQINEKDKRTFCIQKVIHCFQKKRKDILCQNMRLWKRNMYVMTVQRNLLKRVVKKAMNNKVKDLFYAWKLQTEARFMVREHTEEGEVKKRKVEIKRLKKFLDDYKKQKGLLLENQEGNFVVSPRFQQNKEKQLKKQNLLKYKFISRLILSMNGYQSPVKSWTNLQLFTKLRTKCQKSALLVRNRMQNDHLYTTFKIWHNGVKEMRKMFKEMERKDLIRLLNRQKDKMEIDYSKKVDVQQKVERELRRYKLFSYQDKRKQRICAQILFREARKVKSFAFQTWKKRVEQIKDHEIFDLEQRGNNKLMFMEEEVQDLQQRQRELQDHNMMLKQAVQEALELAEIIKRISQERDRLRRELGESDISCQNLQEQNQELNNKLILAQKQAMNLLTLSSKGL